MNEGINIIWHWWNDTDGGKTEVTEKKTIPAPLCPP
jgi:hypothetical protein